MQRTTGVRYVLKSAVIVVASLAFAAYAIVASQIIFGEGPPLIWFVPAVLVTSYFVGLYPGLLTTLGAALIASYSFLAPGNSFVIASHNDQARLIIFIFIGVFSSAVIESLHRARHKIFLSEKAKSNLCEELAAEVERRKIAETSVKRQQEVHRLILSSVPAGITYIGLDRKYRFCNGTFASWFQMPAEDIVEKSVEEIIGEKFYKDMIPRYEEVFTGKRVSFEEFRSFRDKDRYVHVDLVPDFSEDGTVRGCFVLKYDISDHIDLERHLEEAKLEAESANRAKSYFLANMSHEIRTPLTVVLGFSTLLANSKVEDTERRKWSQVVLRNGELLNTLIGDILDFSKIEAGKVEIEKSAAPPKRDHFRYFGHSRIQSQGKGHHRLSSDRWSTPGIYSYGCNSLKTNSI